MTGGLPVWIRDYLKLDKLFLFKYVILRFVFIFFVDWRLFAVISLFFSPTELLNSSAYHNIVSE